MNRVLVLGATGALGKALLKKLSQRGLRTRALAPTDDAARKIEAVADQVRVGDASRQETLATLCDDVDAVVSALGKPVSLFSNDDASFHDVDFRGNSNVLELALCRNVKRFIYISIYGSEFYGDDFALARAHRDFERLLKDSGISHTILRPVGLFSGILDLLKMAREGAVITIGTGEHKTNPIHHEDLAQLAVEHLDAGPDLREVGGPDVFTRWQIGEMVCKAMDCPGHVRVPDLAAGLGVPLVRLYDRNFFDKLAFFKEVLTRDAVAPPCGTHRLQSFVEEAARDLKAA